LYEFQSSMIAASEFHSSAVLPLPANFHSRLGASVQPVVPAAAGAR
jgi:hypothetical protein